MKQTLSIGLRQSLAMTPQLQQAIRLLQLSTLDLQAEVQEVLDSNLMIELADDDAAGASANGTEPGKTNGEGGALEGVPEVGGARAEADVAPADIPSELPVDSAWEDIYDGGAPASLAGGPADGGTFDFDAQRGATETLHDYLHSQLSITRLSAVDQFIAAHIIDAIDDDGYLQATLEDLHQGIVENLETGRAQPVDDRHSDDSEGDYPEGDTSDGANQAEGTALNDLGLDERDLYKVGLDEVEACLHQVQNFDPPGVGARNLKECLRLQLAQLPVDTPQRDEAMKLVDAHLAELAARDYTRLMRAMKLDKAELQQVIELVTSLNPRPGGAIQSSASQYVTPEVFVNKVRGVWRVELNVEALPKLRVNSHYANLIKRATQDDGTGALKGQLQEARWFIKSLRSRSETLLKVATCIVERQQAFLDHGDESMKPMVLADIAEAVGMHESTISRVTTQKYMHTPRGIYELKYFFSSHVYTKAGAECSSTAIRAVLKKMIAAENAAQPLSDSKLAKIMSEQGINVARRTIAKYREAMSIPSSSERRKLV
ncbi:MAG: RNA polymerase factor sigma-54 [Gammaproteobacteria bacterium]